MSEDVTTGSVPTEKELEEELLARTLAAKFFNKVPPPRKRWCSEELFPIFPADISLEMVNAIGVYHTLVSQIYDTLTSLRELDSDPPQTFYELKVDYSHIVPEGFGTLDCAFVCDRNIHIFDFKYTKREKLYAKDNTQLILYALGMIKDLEKREDLTVAKGRLWVTLHIIQPRLDHYSSLKYFPHEMLDWADSLKAKAL